MWRIEMREEVGEKLAVIRVQKQQQRFQNCTG